MLGRAKPCGASLTKVSLIVFQARRQRRRTRSGTNVPAPPPDRGCRVCLASVALFSFIQFPAVSPVDSKFHGQAEGNLKPLWPGYGLLSRGQISVQRPGTALFQEHCHGHQTF
jgi:hypothetical protein